MLNYRKGFLLKLEIKTFQSLLVSSSSLDVTGQFVPKPELSPKLYDFYIIFWIFGFGTRARFADHKLGECGCNGVRSYLIFVVLSAKRIQFGAATRRVDTFKKH